MHDVPIGFALVIFSQEPMMPGLIDCAVLLSAARENWLDAWLARNNMLASRVRLHPHELPHNADGQVRVEALRDTSLSLLRYDVALLPVSYTNVSWARTALAVLHHSQNLSIPLLALVRDLRAAAIQDLLDLGVADFVRDDANVDDVRVRTTQLAATRRNPYYFIGKKDAPTTTAGLDDANASLWEFSANEPETFRAAKRRVIANFERHYLTRILMRHAGNISMAARAAQKHRRAFWELMRKHQIDANYYRGAVCPETEDHSPPSKPTQD